MKTSDELFLLIKSMTRNEKGYFKKFASINSKNGDGNYLRLFDCVAEMEAYDEKIIKQKFKGAKFLTQLNVTKLYLQKMIIKSLRNYHSESDPDIERLYGMIEVQMLLKKHLYDSALRTLRALKAKLETQEVQLTHLYLLQLEYQILLRKGMYEEILETVHDKFEVEKSEIRNYENLCHYRYLQALAMSRTQIEGYTRNETEHDIRDILNDPMLTNPAAPLTFKAALHRLEIQNKCYLKIGDAQKAYESSLAMVETFRSNPEKINLLPYNYFASLNSLVNRCIASYKYKEALKYVDEIKKVLNSKGITISDSQRFEMESQMREKELVIYGGMFEFKKGIEAEQKLLAFIGGKPVRKEFKVTVLYFGAVCYFAEGRYDETLEKINELVHGDYDNIRKDIVLSAHILNILLHFQLKNYRLIQRLITVVQNYGSKQKFPIAEVTEFLTLLKSFIKAFESDNITAYKKAAKAIANKVGQYDFVDEDILMWWLKKTGAL